jgi:ABC-type uncharacterized transport system auxiliary subunit
MRFLSQSSNTNLRRGASAATTLLALGLCVFLANCGATHPVHYYTLETMPSAPAQAQTVYPITLVVGHITTPLLYRDDRLVFGNGTVELGADFYNRWAETPASMIESMLLDDLRATGAFRSVQLQSSNAKADYIVRGRLSAFNEVDNGGNVAARFVIEFELYQPKTGAVVWTAPPYAHDEPVNGKATTAVVEALQTNVRAGLQQVTSSITQYFASHPAQ